MSKTRVSASCFAVTSDPLPTLLQAPIPPSLAHAAGSAPRTSKVTGPSPSASAGMVSLLRWFSLFGFLISLDTIRILEQRRG